MRAMIEVEIELANYVEEVLARAGHLPADKVRKVRTRAKADLWFNYVVLSPKIAEQLGLRIVGEAVVRDGQDYQATCPMVQDLSVEVLGRRGVFRAIIEASETGARIGTLVLADFDLLADSETLSLKPRDPTYIVDQRD
jgi:hypothetical protein